MKTLLEKTMERLMECDRPLSLICKDAEVEIRWAYSLIEGKIEDPGVNKIERLYNTLKKPKFKPMGD